MLSICSGSKGRLAGAAPDRPQESPSQDQSETSITPTISRSHPGAWRGRLTCQRDLEGIVAKWKRGAYVEGEHTNWVKIKNRHYSQAIVAHID